MNEEWKKRRKVKKLDEWRMVEKKKSKESRWMWNGREEEELK